MIAQCSGWSTGKMAKFLIRPCRTLSLRRFGREYPHVIVHDANERKLHVVLPDQSLQWIALKHFGDVRFAGLLFRVNYGALRFMPRPMGDQLLVPGQVIVLPTKKELILHRNRRILEELLIAPFKRQT